MEPVSQDSAAGTGEASVLGAAAGGAGACAAGGDGVCATRGRRLATIKSSFIAADFYPHDFRGPFDDTRCSSGIVATASRGMQVAQRPERHWCWFFPVDWRDTPDKPGVLPGAQASEDWRTHAIRGRVRSLQSATQHART